MGFDKDFWAMMEGGKMPPESGPHLSGTFAALEAGKQPPPPVTIENLWSDAALAEAAGALKKRIDRRGRVDLRHIPFVTVDPLGARDLDDAFHVEKTADGFTLRVAVADVAAWIRPGGAIDRESRARGMSYYHPFFLHMLPEKLAQDKCSLLPRVDRMAIVVTQYLDGEGRMRHYDVQPGIIRSRAQLSYGQFYDLLERDAPLFRAARALHGLQRQAGAVAKNLSDQFAQADSVAWSTKSMVETLMVQTNMLLARHLEKAGAKFLFRNNGPGANIEQYKVTLGKLSAMGYVLPDDPDLCDRATLRALEREAIARRQGAKVRDILYNDLTGRAYYSTRNRGHQTMELDHYAHFTSPIRRYADVLNIRALYRLWGNKTLGLRDEDVASLDGIASHLNRCGERDRDVIADIKKFRGLPGGGAPKAPQP